MRRKSQLPKDADPTFKRVLKAVNTGKSPTMDAARKREEKREKTTKAAQKKLEKLKKRRGDSSGDDVIDSGQFSS